MTRSDDVTLPRAAALAHRGGKICAKERRKGTRASVSAHHERSGQHRAVDAAFNPAPRFCCTFLSTSSATQSFLDLTSSRFAASPAPVNHSAEI